jgi:DNA phosphorothioation-associated DGQHR protein 1
MNPMVTYPLLTPAIPVDQPLGSFYLVTLPVEVLLDTCYSDRLKAVRRGDGTGYDLDGAQRELQVPRLKQIAQYINIHESAFPNTIILAANFRETDGLAEHDEGFRWRILPNGDGTSKLLIPTPTKLAPIIDGQHRLFAHRFAREERLKSGLVCSIFLDLPKPFQAFLFATINSTQKPVNKSQTYDLFGYNLENEPPESWSPDKLSVFLARKLNTDVDSPLVGRIQVAAENDFALTRSEAAKAGKWVISMATVVEGIGRLISQNPRRDGLALLERRISDRKRGYLHGIQDISPLREPYLEGNDKLVYLAVLNFLKAADEEFWSKAGKDSFIKKTVGLQASFDILRQLAHRAYAERDVSESFFRASLHKASHVDFAGPAFQNASGSGRSHIRKALEICLGLKQLNDLSPEDQAEFKAICKIE